jgi:hypothetical protein
VIRWSDPARDEPIAAPLREHAVSREPIQAGASTAFLERLVLASGRRLVAKHISPQLDWMMRATRDTGRAAELWVFGVMDRCPSSIDPALVRIEDDGADGWYLYMEEVEFHRRGTRFSPSEIARALGALADLHAAYWHEPPAGLCSLADLLTMLAPERVVDADPGFAELVRSGWEIFPEHVPAEVADAVLARLADPAPLVAELEGHGMTLLHSDPHFANAALLPDRLVLIDWSLAAAGPPAVDFVWFLDQSFPMLDASHDDVTELFLRAEDGRVQDEMVDAACLAQLVNTGWQVRHWIDGDERDAHEANLAWFVDRARRYLAG